MKRLDLKSPLKMRKKEVKMRIPGEQKDYFSFAHFRSYLYKAWCENYDHKKEDFHDEFEKFCTYIAREMVQNWITKKYEEG